MSDANKSREQLLQEIDDLRQQIQRMEDTQREAVQKLQEERQIFLNGPTVIFKWKNAPGWPVKYASPNVKEVFGYAAEDFLEERISYAEILFSEDLERVVQEVQKANESGVSYFEHVPYRVIHKNGNIVWLDDFTTIMRDATGKSTYYLGYVTNITARKLAEDRYKEAEEERKKIELQLLHAQKLESLGVLTGGIAHDFNNLLTGILGNAGFIRLNLSKNSEFEGPLQDIESASIRAAELCKQMLAYSGKGKFLVQAIHLNHLIQEITHLLEISISKNVTIHYRFSKDLPLIEGDATQIRQIIMNLITNASDAIGTRSGKITVTTGVLHCSPESFEKLNFTKKQEEGFYIFAEVEDTGCGIDKQNEKKIFDPFFTTKFAGRGLGLSAVMGIMRSHHGAIQVESEVGKGSRFRVLFPYSSKVTHVSEDVSPLEIPIKKASGTVLVIDDEQAVRDVASRILKMVGFKVIEVSLGKEGVLRFHQHRKEICLVLLDLTMPEQNGIETFAQLRAIEPKLPILVSSGYNEDEVADLLQKNKNTAGFVQKPYLPESLLVAIQKLVCPE